MELFRRFLENSTIHGLTYISTTTRFSRLFWFLIVVGGFILSGILIYQSFHSWDERPIDTTIETLPIAALKFPRITVCPPKNSPTYINYHLVRTENITLGKMYS